jgi:hypothetical protein
MAFDHRYTVDASLKREIDARLTSVASAAWDEALRRAERARNNPFNRTNDYGLDADGNHTMSTAEHERVGYEILHPSARIWRDEKTLAVSAFSLWQPELVAGAHMFHGAATGDDDEAAAGLNNLFFSFVLRGAGKGAGRPRANAYSVAYETTIPEARAGTRAAHFEAANANLLADMKAHPELATITKKLGIEVPVRVDGTPKGQSPAGWPWHHVPGRPGVMQLVPTAQHTGSAWQWLLHPFGRGGFAEWGKRF